MIEIINLRKEKPSEPYDFKVDRSSVFGNPFYMDKEHSRDEVCRDYVEYLRDKIAEGDTNVIAALNALFFAYIHYGKLRLFCWCVPKRCHAETIKHILLDKFRLEKEKGRVR